MARAFETVTPAEGARLRGAGAQVVDARETVEWRRGHDVRGGLSAWRRDGLPFEA